jgi:hypothetical protein
MLKKTNSRINYITTEVLLYAILSHFGTHALSLLGAAGGMAELTVLCAGMI